MGNAPRLLTCLYLLFCKIFKCRICCSASFSDTSYGLFERFVSNISGGVNSGNISFRTLMIDHNLFLFIYLYSKTLSNFRQRYMANSNENSLNLLKVLE